MAPRSESDLVRIGKEAFSLIDEHFGRKRSSYRYNYYQPPQETYFYQPQEPNKVVRVTNGSSSADTNKEAIIMMKAGSGSRYEKAPAPQKFHKLSYY